MKELIYVVEIKLKKLLKQFLNYEKPIIYEETSARLTWITSMPPVVLCGFFNKNPIYPVISGNISYIRQ